MDLNHLLETDLEPIPRISPSSFIELKTCALRGVLGALKFPALLPGSPDAHLGSIIHKMYELASNKVITTESSFNEKWNEVLKHEENKMVSGGLERNLVPLERHANNFEVKKNLCLHKIKSSFPAQPVEPDNENYFSSVRSSTAITGSERWIETADKKLGGIIDEIRQVINGVEIIDYKSGELFEKAPDGTQRIKEAYQIQLKIYAGLYFLNFGKWPVKLKLTSMRQSSVDISFKAEECLSLVEEAKQKLKEINNLITHKKNWEDLATPAPKTCRYCAFRPVCKKYINSRRDEGDWSHDAIGKIKEKRLFQNGYWAVLETNTGKLNVRGLEEHNHSIFKDEIEYVMIFNLKKDSSVGNFVSNNFTVSYTIPPSFL